MLALERVVIGNDDDLRFSLQVRVLFRPVEGTSICLPSTGSRRRSCSLRRALTYERHSTRPPLRGGDRVVDHGHCSHRRLRGAEQVKPVKFDRSPAAGGTNVCQDARSLEQYLSGKPKSYRSNVPDLHL